MAQRFRNVPPEIDAKWMEFRRKHEEETDNFQRNVAKNRAQFENRVDKAKQSLLVKHLEEERMFWSKNGPGSRISRTPAPAARNSQVQTTRKPQGTATPARGIPAPSKAPTPSKVPAPAKKPASAKPTAPAKTPVPTWTPGPAPALPRMAVLPARKTASQTHTQESARPSMPSPRVARKGGDNEVIVLSSDDEADPIPSKKKSAAPTKISTVSKPVDTNTAQPPKPTQESIVQEYASPESVINKFSSTLPEATLEFFGGLSMTQAPPPVCSFVKEVPIQHSSPHDLSCHPLPSTPPQKVFHGLPEAPSPSPFLARGPPATSPFGSPGSFTPFTPPATPGFGSWSSDDNGPLSSYSPQATSVRQCSQRQPAFSSNSPFARQTQFGGTGPGSSSPFPSLSKRSENAVPTSFASQSRSPLNFGKPSSRPALPGPSVKNLAGLANEQRADSLPENYDAYPEGVMSVETAPDMASEVVDGGSIVRREQDESMSDEDVRMLHVAQVSLKPTASSLESSSTFNQQQGYPDPRPSTPMMERPGTPSQQLPSPPSSDASVVFDQTKPTQHRVSAPGSAFKLPTAPASAAAYDHSRQSVALQARNVRAGTVDSRASSFTLPAQLCSERDVSVSSRTSYSSARTGATQSHKRKEYNLSDDEDEVSDYAPSEPDSPLAGMTAKGGKVLPSVKRTKISTDFTNKAKGNNGYGFKPTVAPNSKSATSTSSSRASVKRPLAPIPTTPSKPAATPVTVVRASSVVPRKGVAVVRAKPASAAKSVPKNKAVSQPSRRKAAMNAENKIQGYFEDTEEFETECAIEDADQLEDACLPETLRRMSITPVPGDESVAVLMEEMTHPAKGHYTFDSWTCDRAKGDRNMTKKYGGSDQTTDVDEEEDEEADISEYISVGGVIVQRNEAEELDLTGNEQGIRSGMRGGERGWWGQMKGAIGCRTS
ncbi:hypothetical protein DE146DRAFT_758141 [Phaeosphaeria sp. MPI-PUGE-AT-0046c]|nr:hypothetical protein DE146DRAFT_758141 [Phaeosphaeria sp. MPI-PUGE-AT-0046c]